MNASSELASCLAQDNALSQSKNSPSVEALVDMALLELGQELKRRQYQFISVTPATHDRVNRRSGNERAHDVEGVLGWSRRFQPDVVPHEILRLMQQANMIEPLDNEFRSRLRVSSLDKHLFFHSAYPTSQADAVFFGPDTYRFASAIRQFLLRNQNPVRRAIDIGCGAGPGAILVAEHFPEAEVLAADINHKALQLAAVNAALAGTGNVKPCFSNLLTNVAGSFDLIVSNPPYLIDPGKRAYRHGGGEFGAGLSMDILAASLSRLSTNGTLLLYTGSAIVHGKDLFFQAVQQTLCGTATQWTYHEMDPDIFGEELSCEAYSNADRIAAVILTVTKLA
jgi:methylase of polypeptide subunit release factors